MIFKHIVLIAGACALLQGCAGASIENSWKSTKSFYANYVNTPAVIDYEDKGAITEAEAALARRMRGVEYQMLQLERAMANADRAPSPEAVNAILARFPWLSGIALMDISGEILAQQPMPMKSLDFTPLLDRTGRNGDLRGLRGMVQDTPLGAEVFVAIPIYRSAELMGLLITHFDMRSLLAYADEPGDLVVVAPEATLWSGRFVFDSTPMAEQDWKALAAANPVGTVSNANGEFLWLTRYLGTQPLVFGVPAKGEFTEDPNQLAIIGEQSPVMAPTTDFDPMRGTPSLLESPVPHIPMSGGVYESPVLN